jgi:hypothetical protein
MKIRLYLPVVLITVLFLIPAAQGQDKILESEVTYYVQTANGQPAVCGVDMTTVFNDHTYRKGALSGVRSVLSWFEDRGNLGILLKVSGVDFDGSTPPQHYPFKIANAFVAVKGVPLTATPGTCENQLNFCGTYWLPVSAALSLALNDGNLSIGFNRQQGALDILLPLKNFPREITEFERYSDPSFTAFNTCNGALTKRVKAHNGR